MAKAGGYYQKPKEWRDRGGFGFFSKIYSKVAQTNHLSRETPTEVSRTKKGGFFTGDQEHHHQKGSIPLVEGNWKGGLEERRKVKKESNEEALKATS